MPLTTGDNSTFLDNYITVQDLSNLGSISVSKQVGTIKGISSWDMEMLQVDVIFGIGAFFLYIVVPVALLANEVRLAKRSDDTSGSASILSAMAQAAFSIVAWLAFVTIILYLVVGAAGDTMHNPAVGIYHFWSVDWIGTSTMASLDSGGSIFSQAGNEELLVQAQALVFVLAMAKLIEFVLLAVLLFLTVSLSMFLPVYKMRRSSSHQVSDLDLSAILAYGMIFAMGLTMFTLIVNMIDMLLESVLIFAHNRYGALGAYMSDTDIDVLSGLWNLFAYGIAKW